MTQNKSRISATREPATTNDCNYRTFLLVAQLEAKAIGARIARARNEQGMTQEEMCELTTFSKRSLSDYENGVTLPYKHLREISALLSRPVEFFLHGEPEAEADELLSIAARLQSLEATVAESIALSREMLLLLRETPQQVAAAPPARKRANG